MMQTDSPVAFGELAADYQRYRIGYSGELFDVLESLGLQRGASVLDVGCGTGLSSAPLVARGMRVTGLDPSAEMLSLARSALPQASFVEGRAEAIGFADRTFDAVVSAQAFHWLEGDAAMAELVRVLKPGGFVGIWWKILSNDDTMREHRAAAAREAGVTPVDDPLAGGLRAFYRAPLATRTVRVLPFTARLSVDDWLGYERSRARARHAYGAKASAYLDALAARLIAAYGSRGAALTVRYTQFLYSGQSAA